MREERLFWVKRGVRGFGSKVDSWLTSERLGEFEHCGSGVETAAGAVSLQVCCDASLVLDVPSISSLEVASPVPELTILGRPESFCLAVSEVPIPEVASLVLGLTILGLVTRPLSVLKESVIDLPIGRRAEVC